LLAAGVGCPSAARSAGTLFKKRDAVAVAVETSLLLVMDAFAEILRGPGGAAGVRGVTFSPLLPVTTDLIGSHPVGEQAELDVMADDDVVGRIAAAVGEVAVERPDLLVYAPAPETGW
jgi:hypothetical protein